MTEDPGLAADLTALDAEVLITANATNDLAVFNLDFTGFVVDELTVNEESADLGRRGHELIVTPATPIRAGSEFVVAIRIISRAAAWLL